jgi:hypothetical protein
MGRKPIGHGRRLLALGTLTPNVRLRPELHYDIHSGSGRDAFGGGAEDAQLVGSFDISLFF